MKQIQLYILFFFLCCIVSLRASAQFEIDTLFQIDRLDADTTGVRDESVLFHPTDYIHQPRFVPRGEDFKTQYWSMTMFAHGKGGSFDNRWTLSADDLFRYYIPVPSESEQDAIADYLDYQCGKIDSVIEQTQASVEEYKKLRQSVITQAVTKGVRGRRPTKNSGVEWIGAIPEEWDVFRVAALYEERKENGNDELPILTVSINTGVSDRELSD